MILNQALMEKQNINDCEEQYLLTLHLMREVLFEFESTLDPQDNQDRPVFKQMVPVLENIEFAMQKAWRFEASASHHTWWDKWSNCSCPLLDNQDLFGMPQRIFNMNCPFHGKDM